MRQRRSTRRRRTPVFEQGTSMRTRSKDASSPLTPTLSPSDGEREEKGAAAGTDAGDPGGSLTQDRLAGTLAPPWVAPAPGEISTHVTPRRAQFSAMSFK